MGIIMFKEIPAGWRSTSRRKLLFGVGINDVNYQVKIRINGKRICCAFYQKWVSLLQRCYSKEYQKRSPNYKGCTVCHEWLTFSNFKEWMENQDWKGKQIDKDIAFTGNKVYSPEKCIFVSPRINYLIVDQKNHRGKQPRGVNLDARTNKFISTCSVMGKAKHLGTFDSAEKASQAYIDFKSKLIISVSEFQKEPLKGYLIRIANELKN